MADTVKISEQDRRDLDAVRNDEYDLACRAREARDDSGALQHFRRAAALRRITLYLAGGVPPLSDRGAPNEGQP